MGKSVLKTAMFKPEVDEGRINEPWGRVSSGASLAQA